MGYYIPDSNKGPRGPMNPAQMMGQGLRPSTTTYDVSTGRWNKAALDPALQQTLALDAARQEAEARAAEGTYDPTAEGDWTPVIYDDAPKPEQHYNAFGDPTNDPRYDAFPRTFSIADIKGWQVYSDLGDPIPHPLKQELNRKGPQWDTYGHPIKRVKRHTTSLNLTPAKFLLFPLVILLILTALIALIIILLD